MIVLVTAAQQRLFDHDLRIFGPFLALLGVVAAVIGWYGWRHVSSLVPDNTSEQTYAHRVSVIRRGAAACLLVGALLTAAAIAVEVVV
jgi:hypothetical protein